ncbi:MAG: choice-of-anchor I family protein, partial [Bacteroidota bacterium]
MIDYSDPTAPFLDDTIILNNFGEEVTSVAAYNSTVAVAVKAADQGNGTVVFIDTDGNILSDVTVGSLPDMVTFTPDGTKVLVANEGEPNDEYTVDPEGTVSIIDVSGGFDTLSDTDVTSLNFNAFDANQAALEDAGVRIFGPGASVSQDLEPEFISVTEDSQTAYVSLQENNAYAIVDIAAATITDILPYGFKDHSLVENAFDVSNDLDFVFMSTWNTLGMLQPDAIANYNVDGTNYIVTANEGDARDYDGFSEEVRVDDLDLDPTAYPNADLIQIDEFLGRLKTTTATGDIDGDGDIDQIYSYGGRSFSILNATTGETVYDSGDLLERITKEDPVYGAIFNATDDENAFKNRSDDKGPEPEAVTLAQIEDNWYAFVGLERIGGIAVFDITDPTAPTFETYVNNRETTPDDEDPDGDLAPEGVIYIAPENNATGNGLIVIANEVSSTISTYILENDILSTEDFDLDNGISFFPNPSEDGIF